jgi:hypothetical protein
MSTSAYLRLRSTDLERSITILQTTKQQLADNYELRHHSQSEAPSFSLIENELQLKQQELAEVRAVLKK